MKQSFTLLHLSLKKVSLALTLLLLAGWLPLLSYVQTWSVQNPVPVSFNGIWGAGADNVWAVGEGGTIRKWQWWRPKGRKIFRR